MALCGSGAALAAFACGGGGKESGFGGDGGSPVTVGGDASPQSFADSPTIGNLLGDGTVPFGEDSGTGIVVQGSPDDAPYYFDGFTRPDGYSEASYCTDDDNDGFTTCDGDCDDHDSLVNPCAFDTNAASGDAVGTDGIDNDCDGTIDNRITCDSTLTAGQSTTAGDYATAMELCANPKCPIVKAVTFNTLSSNEARRITAHMGNTFTPHAGSFMTYISSGIAEDDVDTTPAANPYYPGNGTGFGAGGTNPSPLTAAQNPNACSATGANENDVSSNDMVELDLTLTAPVNAGSFTFDFNFFSEEYPLYVCAGYNDTFLAMLTSQQYPTPTQISYDQNGHRVNVNNGFFVDCPTVTNEASGGSTFSHTCSGGLAPLAKTGYEHTYSGNSNKGSGATDWLKTTAPIHPGETFTLKFYIFDEQDDILDSAVNLDNFRWGSTTVSNPITAR
jgi:hypothetical protein